MASFSRLHLGYIRQGGEGVFADEMSAEQKAAGRFVRSVEPWQKRTGALSVVLAPVRVSSSVTPSHSRIKLR